MCINISAVVELAAVGSASNTFLLKQNCYVIHNIAQKMHYGNHFKFAVEWLFDGVMNLDLKH